MLFDKATLPHRPAVRNAVAECGWGRVIFGNSFPDVSDFAESLREEQPNCRDIAIYITNPHVLLAKAPHELFLDPSHTYRLSRDGYEPDSRPVPVTIRPIRPGLDVEGANRIFAARGMVEIPAQFFDADLEARGIYFLVAEDQHNGEVAGVVMGVDHSKYLGADDKGSSLWCLAVDPQARQPGIGKALSRRLAELFWEKGAEYMDLTVMHDNEQAIALYEKLGFERIQSFTVKRKNTINEKLFSGPNPDAALNPYARIIVDEARRRGIHADLIDEDTGIFRLSYGGRSIICRESLSELTSAVAMSICDNKAVSRRVVEAAGVKVPDQIVLEDDDPAGIAEFLAKHGSVVVKPVRGEQGQGISVGLTDLAETVDAVGIARKISDKVLLEEYFEGQDLRIVVINYRMVAAAIRRPATVIGDGRSSIQALIEAQSRRRAAATDGESRIPVDAETRRILAAAGFSLDDILPDGQELQVRKTANLHTGGTIHDVTDMVHPDLVEAAVNAANAIEIPVVGIDLMVRSPVRSDYVFIEANERPGLANHEPQPTAQRFIDLLFPLSVPTEARKLRAVRKPNERTQ